MRLVCALLAALAAASVLSIAGAAATNLSGRVLFIKDGDLWVLDTGGPHVMATGGAFSQPTWAPDGGSLAYVYRGTNFADIFVSDATGENQTRLTNSQSTVLDNNDWNLRPTWSPDGKTIAFVSDRSTAFPTLWFMNAADGAARRAVTSPGLQQEAVDSMSWSPDGTQLAYTLYNDPGPTQIAILPVASGGRQPGHLLTTLVGGAFDPSWSPDGNWIAFAGRDGYASEVYAMRTDGSGLTRFTNDGLLDRSPVWSPDGQHLAYMTNRTGYYELAVLDVAPDGSGGLTPSGHRLLTQDLHVDANSGLSWGR
ncbi:MAG: hypothetical protein NVSMB2_17460 [Chloroflexota bacterium]